MQTPRSVRVSRGVSEYWDAHSKMVKLLIREGIATQLPYACPKIDCGPLDLACHYGNDEAASAILDISPEISHQNIAKLAGTIGLDTLLTTVDCGFADTIDVLLSLLVSRDDISKYNILNSAVHHQPALVPKIYSYFEIHISSEPAKGQLSCHILTHGALLLWILPSSMVFLT
jgi:hypothetical protein